MKRSEPSVWDLFQALLLLVPEKEYRAPPSEFAGRRRSAPVQTTEAPVATSA